jgi:integrase
MSSSIHRRLPLQDSALAASSLRAYNSNLIRFLTHARLSPHQFLTAPAHQLDRLLAVFIQHSHDRRRPFAYAAHALHAAIFHRPDLKQQLHSARQCLRGWERTKLSRSHPPLTWELTALLACTLLRSGHHGPAVGMLVAFDCYLRVSELTRLRRCDIVMPNDPRFGAADTNMAIVLKHTKTGANQSVPLFDVDVAAVLCHWMQHTAVRCSRLPDARVFDFTPARLRQLMYQACVLHGLHQTPYVPHSLRHGGATCDFLRTNSISYVQFRGRWKSMESARRYIQTSRALLAAQQVPSRLNDLGGAMAESLVSIFAHALSSVPEAPTSRPSRRVTFGC